MLLHIMYIIGSGYYTLYTALGQITSHHAGCPRIKFTSWTLYYTEYKKARTNIDIYAYGCVTKYLRDFEKFPY